MQVAWGKTVFHSFSDPVYWKQNGSRICGTVFASKHPHQPTQAAVASVRAWPAKVDALHPVERLKSPAGQGLPRQHLPAAWCSGLDRAFQSPFAFFFRLAHHLRFASLRRFRAAALIRRRLGFLVR